MNRSELLQETPGRRRYPAAHDRLAEHIVIEHVQLLGAHGFIVLPIAIVEGIAFSVRQTARLVEQASLCACQRCRPCRVRNAIVDAERRPAAPLDKAGT